jgi:hypothetical protein
LRALIEVANVARLLNPTTAKEVVLEGCDYTDLIKTERGLAT